MIQGYQEDLAYIHDTGFGGFVREVAPHLLKILSQKGINKGLAIDLGCGSGTWVQILSAAGYEVLGIDISAAMIALARVKAPEANFQLASFLRVKLPPCEIITSLGECFNYQFDEHGFAERNQFFSNLYAALKPGGLLIFDIAEPGYVSGCNPQTSYSVGKDWAILLEKTEDTRSHKLTRKMTIFRQIGELYRRSEEIHEVQLYQSSEVARELRKIGFRVRIVRGYGTHRFRKSHVGFIASKVC